MVRDLQYADGAAIVARRERTAGGTDSNGRSVWQAWLRNEYAEDGSAEPS